MTDCICINVLTDLPHSVTLNFVFLFEKQNKTKQNPLINLDEGLSSQHHMLCSENMWILIDKW